MRDLEVLVAGGGIGGLTAALCLARKGFRVTVFEQTPGFAEIGAGLQLSPNCTRVLCALGLDDALRATAFVPEAAEFRDWRTGAVISATVLGAQALDRYGSPYYHMHRGDLLAVLTEAAEVDPCIDLRPASRVGGFEQDDRKVRVSVGDEIFAGDLLVGADGIHSQVRLALWGAESPRFTGNVAWRALVPAAALPGGLVRPTASAWWGPGKHVVHYYVRGGELVNCVCVVEKTAWEVESWTEPGEVGDLQSNFSSWHDDIQRLIEHIEPATLFKWGLHDRAPMRQWGRHRVTLLGDACHPTLPFMAQGAAMAIEDAAVLAACLQLGDHVAENLGRYEKLRRKRTASIQAGSRRNARVFHLSGAGAWARNAVVGIMQNRTMDGLFRYDALRAADRSAG